MAILSELRTFVLDIIQDASFVNSEIDALLNRGVNEIAGGFFSFLGSFIIPPLPELFQIDTVETSALAYVSMPATFQRNLQFVANSNGTAVHIYNSMIEFAEDYPLMDKSGSVESVVEQGGNLYYQRIPTVADTLTLHFYRLPVTMTSSDAPDGIPLHLQKPLLVNYASWKVFEIKEIKDGNKINTLQYKSLFQEALRALEVSIPFETRSLFLGD